MESDTEVHEQDPQSALDELEQEEPPDATDLNSSGPILKVRRFIRSNPRVISVDHTPRSGDDEFSATIQNIETAGDIIVWLRWIEDHLEGRLIAPEKEDTVYFKSDERREVSFYAEMPQHVDEYEIRAYPGTHGAAIENVGESGYVDVNLRGDMSGMEINLDNGTAYFDEGEKREIVFDRDSPIRTSDWWVEAEPAD